MPKVLPPALLAAAQLDQIYGAFHQLIHQRLLCGFVSKGRGAMTVVPLPTDDQLSFHHLILLIILTPNQRPQLMPVGDAFI